MHDEIARMIGGVKVGEAAQRAAAELLSTKRLQSPFSDLKTAFAKLAKRTLSEEVDVRPLSPLIARLTRGDLR